MNRIVTRTEAGAAALARTCAQSSARWADASDPRSRRIASACIFMPVLFILATLVAVPHLTFVTALLSVALAAGAALILIALSLFKTSAAVLQLLLLAAYSCGLLVLAVTNHGPMLLALVIAAMPLEAWWLTRDLRASLLALGAALGMLAIWAVAATAATTAVTVTMLTALGFFFACQILRCFLPDQTERPDVKVAATPQLAKTPQDGLQFILNADGTVLSTDTVSAQKLGLPQEMLAGRSLLDHVLVADRVQYLSMLADLRANLDSHPIDIRLRGDLNGVSHFQRFRLHGYCSDGMLVLAGRSLEDEVALQSEISRLEAALEAEQQSKNKLLAAVSHELRTPLNAIIGFSDLLSHEIGHGFSAEKQGEYALLIHKSGNYMLELVNAVLDNARLETGSYTIAPQSFDFSEAVELCTQVMLTQAEQKEIAFCHRVKTDIGALVADRRAVQQILLNLSANAVKFTPNGGCVTIDARRIGSQGRELLEFSLSDTGIGIAAEELERVVQPFTRADNHYTRAQEGSGLGLSVVKGLVELHQGTLAIKSNVGVGTTVTVQLPVTGPQILAGDQLKEELGTVIDIHLSQEEETDECSQDENRNQKITPIRKAG